MAMEPWNPWREMMNMRDAMDRMFQDTFARTGGLLARGGSIPLDIQETDNGYEVEAALPGVRPEDVQITVRDNMLTIRGEVKGEEEQRAGQNWIVRERRAGSFFRSVTLPTPVDADRAAAKFEHGVLRLTLPRSAQAGPKQIRVGAAPSQPIGTQLGAGPRTDTGVAAPGSSEREGVTGAGPVDTSGAAGAENAQQQPS